MTALAAGIVILMAACEGTSGRSGTGVTEPEIHVGWYAAPNGSGAAAGTADAPWDLATALTGGRGMVQPGDTIWLRGGTYGAGDHTSQYTSTLTGTAAAPIIVRQYPGERATINAQLDIGGAHTWYWGFESTNTELNRHTSNGIAVAGSDLKFINLVVHDHDAGGFFLGEQAPNAEVYGSLIYNNGIFGSTSSTHAHGIYIQNTTGTKRIVDNIIFNQFGYNVHAYGEAGHLANITLEGNISFNGGAASAQGDQPNLFVGGLQPVAGLVVQDNVTWDQVNSSTSVWFGYGESQSVDAVVRDNYFAGGAPVLQVVNFQRFTFSGNTLVSNGTPGSMVGVTGSTGGFSWSANSYYGNSSAAEWLWESNRYTFGSWRTATGFGRSDTYRGAQPSGVTMVLRPNQYEPGRANIAVYNWSAAATASVDLSGVLQPGDRYEVRNAQDFFGTPAASGTYGGGAIQLPLRAVEPTAPPSGWQGTPPSTGTRFHAFVVLRVK